MSRPPDEAALAQLRGTPALQPIPTRPDPVTEAVPDPPDPESSAAPPAPRGRLRAVFGDTAGIMALTAVVAAGALTAFTGQAPTGVPVSEQPVGTCHLALDPYELVAIPSDSTPAVPCTQPHQTETMWIDPLTGPLAAADPRPNGQLLNQQAGGQCYDYDRIRAYVGAGPSDVTWGIGVWARFPTAQQWADGSRALTCQGSARTDTPVGPTVSFPLAGVMSTRESVRFRLCRRPNREVTCDQPHQSEATSPSIVLPQGPWQGDTVMLQRATAACRPVVETYLQAPLTSRPDLVVLTDGPREPAWAQGNRSANCSIAYTDGRLTTTTLRGALR